MSYLTDLFKFRVESDASSSYIVLELDSVQNIQNLQVQMIEQNPNPLILPLSYRVINNENLVYYNVTSKVSLKQFLIKKTLKKSAFIDILLSMIKILTECKNYYANDKNFAIDEDLIYVNPISYEVSMMYIPVDFEVDFKSVYKEFIKRVIDNLVQIEEVNELGFLQSIRMYLREESFNLQELQVLLNNFRMGYNNFQRNEPEVQVPVEIPNQPVPNAAAPVNSNQQPPVVNPSHISQSGKGGVIPSIPKSTPSPNQPKNTFIPSAPVNTTITKEKYPASSIIIAVGLQILIIGLIAVAYVFYISKQADKIGPLGGMAIISAALDFLVLRNLFDKKKKVSYIVQVKQKVAQSNQNPPAKPAVQAKQDSVPTPKQTPAAPSKPPVNVSGSNQLNIPGSIRPVTPMTPAQSQNQPKAPNMNKRQIENQSNIPVTPDFSSNSPYDSGNTVILTQPNSDRTVVLDMARQTAYLTRTQDGVTQRIDITSSNFIIGRIPGQVSYILDNKNISKIHAAILNKDGKYYIKDLGSSNGTYLNSNRIDIGVEYEITGNDKIRLAALEYDFKVI